VSATPNDGGPAFPNGLVSYDNGWVPSPGMTLRDYFAAHAMQMQSAWAMQAAMSGKRIPSEQELSKKSFCWADAMLAARERKEDA
jgi:hypothetical protein